jgi:hypothetical protein
MLYRQRILDESIGHYAYRSIHFAIEIIKLKENHRKDSKAVLKITFMKDHHLISHAETRFNLSNCFLKSN